MESNVADVPQATVTKPELELVRMRRAAAGLDTPDDFTLGLALSGGGLRSATFCYGFLRALAKNKVLRKFDYLSTVSGGAYIGAMLGRLYSRTQTAAEVEDGMASDNSLLLWWLRSNGRYLIPAGARDIGIAIASMLRAFFATQVEVVTLMMLFGCLATLPHVLIAAWPPTAHFPIWSAFGSGWWWLTPIPLFCAVIVSWAYWFCRGDINERHKLNDACIAVIAVSIGATLIWWGRLLLIRSSLDFSVEIVGLLTGGVLLLNVFFGYALRVIFAMVRTPIPALRLILTRSLAFSLYAVVLVALLAVYDGVSWRLIVYYYEQGFPWIVGAAGVTTTIVAITRTAAPAVQKFFHDQGLPSIHLLRFANAIGLALLALLVLLCTIVLSTFLFLNRGSISPAYLLDGHTNFAPLIKWAAVFFMITLYMVLSGANLGQLNLASMHYLYRARLARAYVSVGNVRSETDVGRFPVSPLRDATRRLTEKIAKLVQTVEGDDIPLSDYQPHQFGGPVHLIACCINQTVDDRTGNYNADRKGVALTVSSLGVETGAKLPSRHGILQDTTVAQWGVISGAAVASGMGSQTSPGLAALVFLSGFRAGFWSKSLIRNARASRLCRAFAKYRATWGELVASFPGLRSDQWYLSDGGHFDNTGVYGLLKRQVDLIVLADCGADPNYLFEDIENLVRKAKIDYSAQIEFFNPDSIPPTNTARRLRPYLGTPESITPEPGLEYLMAARIAYSSGRIGMLVVVKPRRLSSLPLDIVGYSDRDEKFPQQTTSDQFFDEAQWESYHGLGLHLGRVIDDEFFQFMRDWKNTGFTTQPSTLASEKTELPSAASAAAASRRQRVTQTVQTSLGVGVSLSLVLAAWQAIDQHRSDNEAMRKRFFDTYKEAVTFLKDKTPQTDIVLAAQIQNMRDAADSLGNPPVTDQVFQTMESALAERCKAADKSNFCREYPVYLDPIDTGGNAKSYYWSGIDESHWSGGRKPATGPSKASVADSGTIPPATAAPAPTIASEQPPFVKEACTSRTDHRIRLYARIYSNADRDVVAAFVKNTVIPSGVLAMEIKRVSAIAAQRSGNARGQLSGPSFIYHTDSDMSCARALAAAYQTQHPTLPVETLPLPKGLPINPGVIEFWLPHARNVAK